jgi:hypothetical protein
MRRLTTLIVLAAFILSCGGNWSAIQCVAWANMIRDYSQVVPLPEAVSMTFSGKYPCELCKAIAEEKSSQQQKMLGLDKLQKKFLRPTEISALSGPLAKDFAYALASFSFSSRPTAPPAPPPRSALS